MLATRARAPSPTPQEVASGVYLVALGRGAATSNVYLVGSGEMWTLVDAGWASSAEAIRRAAEAVFGPGARPAAIVLTHIHPDHSGSAGALARSWEVPVYVGAKELPAAAGTYLPQCAMPLDRWVVAPIMRLLPARTRARIEAANSITDVVRPLDPQGGVPGLAEWEWLPTPGHTPGHVAYLRRRDGVVVAGDAALTVDLNSVGGVLFGRPRVAGPPWYTTWGWAAAKRSIKALAELEPRVLLPGHGRPLTAGTAAALRALAQGRPRRAHRRRGPRGLLPRYATSDRYRPPPRLYARLQWLGLALTWLGLSPRGVVTLEVPGRRSGVIHRTNLLLAEHDGERYLVALAGESEWVRNVWAAGGRVVLGRRRRRPATLVEVPAKDRAPVIRAYLLRWGRRPGSAAVAREARDYFGVGADLTLAEIGSVADRYPVFRVMPEARRGGKDVPALSYRTETVIRRPAEDVFDFCSDLRSELQWNPKVKYVEKLTEGPVGVGTRYRAQWANSGPTTVEVVQFDRPRSWKTHTNARGMGIRFQGTVSDAAPGTRYTAYLELQPRRLARLVAPLALWVMRRQDQQNMRRIRQALESTTVTSD